MKPRHVDIETLKRLVLYGSPAGRAAALVILDEVTDGRVLEYIKKLEVDLYGSSSSND